MTALIAFNFAFNGPIANIYKNIRYNYDQEYNGTILDIKTVGGTLRNCTRIKIYYKYEINGMTYFSRRLWNNSSCKNEESTRNFLYLRAGDNHVVYSSTENPTISVLNTATPRPWQYILALLLTAFFWWLFPPVLPLSRKQ